MRLVDLLLRSAPAPSGDVTAPTVTLQDPASGATGSTLTVSVQATFSEAVLGVSGATFQLRNPAGVLVAANVGYNSGTLTALLNPTADLAANTAYTATLTGGTTAIRDAANNPLATTVWTFTTGTGGGTPGPLTGFMVIGDSMSAGQGVPQEPDKWFNIVADLVQTRTGVKPNVFMQGIPGTRMGTHGQLQMGAPISFTVAGGQIPTSGAVTITPTPQDKELDLGDPLAHSNMQLAGVTGTVRKGPQVADPITFTRNGTSGSPTPAAGAQVLTYLTGVTHRNKGLVMWLPHNNRVPPMGAIHANHALGSGQDYINAKLTAMLAYNTSPWKALIGLISGPAEPERIGGSPTGAMNPSYTELFGTDGYGGANGAMRAICGDSQWIDVRAGMLSLSTNPNVSAYAYSNITPTSADIAAAGAGKRYPGPSLQNHPGGHLMEAGQKWVARCVYQHGITYGWWDAPDPPVDMSTRAGIISQAGQVGATTDYTGAYPVPSGTYTSKRFRLKVSPVNGATVILNDCVVDAIDNPAPTTHSGLVENYTGSGTIELNRCRLNPAATSVFWSAALKGHRITANSCEAYDTVDGIQSHGSGGVTVYGCYFHNGKYYTWTPPGGDGQSDGQTHNDGGQHLSGAGFSVTFSVFEKFHNAAIQITRNAAAAVTGVVIDNNWFDGSGWNGTGYDSGSAVINISHLTGANVTIDSVSHNRFGLLGSQTAHIYRTTQTTITAKTDNFMSTGAAINDIAY